METNVREEVRSSILEKQQGVVTWLRATPPQKKQVSLGPAGEEAVETHLEVLEETADRVSSGMFGICTVCHGQIEPELLEMDYTTCVCLGDMSPDEAHKLEVELELAQSVQRSLMPQEVPDIPGLEIAAFSRPAQIIGGDYFDFFQFMDGAHGLAIADVAGHGISASLHMASVQTLLRTLIAASDSPAEVVRRMHHLLVHNVRFATFVTLFLGAFDPWSRTLLYCNAGHNPPLLVGHGDGADAAPRWLWPTGAAIGLVEEFAFGGQAVQLVPGDVLVLYTDGVTETFGHDGRQFGREHLAEVVHGGRNLAARDLIQAIRQELQDFGGDRPPADDTTLIVCRVKD